MLNTDNILKKVSQEAIMSRYFPYSVETNKRYNNPFRPDKTAKCYFAYTKSGTFVFFDNASPSYGGDCFQIAKLALGKEFREVLSIIDTDFNLGLEQSYSRGITPFRDDYIKPDKETKPVDENIEKLNALKEQRYHYNVTVRKWEKIDREYWSRFGISTTLLAKYNIYPVQSYSTRKWNARTFKEVFTYSEENPELCYCYTFQKGKKTSVKLYRPYGSVLDKWKTNTSDEDVQGVDQLPETGDLLVVTSSMKDALALIAVGYNAIAPQGEGMGIPDSVIKNLKKRFTRIVFCYDRDEAGIRYSTQYAKLYECEVAYLPEISEKKLKDFAEYREHLGKALFIKLVKTIFSNFITE